jgi:hypothetical protein
MQQFKVCIGLGNENQHDMRLREEIYLFFFFHFFGMCVAKIKV